MAQSRMAKLVADSWLERVEPQAPEGLTVIVAYVSGNPDRGWRLYTDAELTQYYDVADSDVVHGVQLKSPDFPLGGSVVWVKQGATLRHSRTTSRQTQAGMLSGTDFASHEARLRNLETALSGAAMPAAGRAMSAQYEISRDSTTSKGPCSYIPPTRPPWPYYQTQ